MKLNNRQIRFLKARAHHLDPVVTVGNAGLTENVLHEVERGLSHHELMKVRLPAIEKPLRKQMVDSMCAHCDAVSVGQIGRIAILYRPATKPVIVLPA